MTCTAERHDTVYAYNHFGCRCPEARRLNCLREKRRMLYIARNGHGLWVDGTGLTRRLRALCVLGHNTHTLAAELGSTQAQVRRWLRGGTRVHVESLNRVRDLYDRLSMSFGEGPRADRTKTWAAGQGWVPPLAWEDDEIDDPKARPKVTPRVQQYRWLDEIAVEEALAGRRVKLSHVERAEVVRRIRAQGGTHRDIAERLGISLYAADRLRSRVTARDAA